MAKARITSNLSRWLGHRITVEQIDVVWNAPAASLEITISYRVAGTPDSRVLRFQRSSN